MINDDVTTKDDEGIAYCSVDKKKNCNAVTIDRVTALLTMRKTCNMCVLSSRI